MKKICIITNIAPHYREPVFSLIDREIGCDFYIGDHVEYSIKTFDYNKLKGYRKTVHNIFFKHFYWQRGTIRLLFKPYKYYILDGEPYCLSTWIILILSKILRKQTISWSHGFYGKEHGIKKTIKKVFYSLFNKLMLYNDYAINIMSGLGFKKEKMSCIANSMDSDRDKELRKNLKVTNIYSEHFHNNNPTVIYCGRIQKRKKLYELVDALSIIKSEGLIINAIFIGNDHENVGIDKYAYSKGLGCNIWMYGACYDDKKLSELFYNATVCVSPGNVGLTAIHSLSFGCPVITHNNFSYQMPEFEAIKPGITGDFFEQDNIKDLANKIKKWCSLSSNERNYIRLHAFSEIDSKWNIQYQLHILKKVLEC